MRTITIILFLVSLISCRQGPNQHSGQMPVELPASIGNYLSNYTDQMIDINEHLTFRFSGDVIDRELVGTTIGNDLFNIKPKVDGRAYWKDRNTLVFEPSALMEYDRNYEVTIYLSQLYPDVEEAYRATKINYRTKPLDLKVSFNQIQYGGMSDVSNISLSGHVSTNNIISNEAIEKLLTAKQKGNDELQITWSHHSKKSRGFTISNIKRSSNVSQVEIKWNDGHDNKDSRTFEVLAKGEFKLIHAEVIEGADHILVSFSDRLDLEQDIDGLISIDGYRGDLTYDKAGSKVRVYWDRKPASPFSLEISKNIKGQDGRKLSKNEEIELSLEPLKPGVKLIGEGVIVPDADKVILPFVTSNLNSVTVEVFKIFQDNVLQFLQYGQLDKSHNLVSVGRVVHQQKIQLEDYTVDSTPREKRIAVNIRDLVRTEPGALYQVRIGFDQTDVTDVECPISEEDAYALDISEKTSIMSHRYTNYNHRQDPCYADYYSADKYISRNILSSDLGIIAQYDAEDHAYITVTSLQSVDPLAGVSVDFYDYQQQLIASTSTDSKGKVVQKLERRPSFAILQHNNRYGYVSMQDRYANNLSEFDVSGKVKKEGVDGMIYGERGVWRPGDTLFLNFILEDAYSSLPSEHPIKMEVVDAKSRKRFIQSTSKHEGQMYHFAVPTSSADPTGNWRATVTVGNQTFSKTLKVETVKPNRLKIDVNVASDRLAIYEDEEIDLSSQWLHGATAAGLKAKVDLQLSSAATKFQGYGQYHFDDPARKTDAVPVTIYEGALDDSGSAQIKVQKQKDWLPPGKLNSLIKTRVYEKSGNYSEDYYKVATDIYSHYVGVKIPKTRWGSAFISNQGDEKVLFQTVDAEGKPVGNRKLNIGIYEARWSWWYDRAYSTKYNYNSSSHNGALIKDSVMSNADGEAGYTIDLESDYGTYMIRICDEESGHCTGGMFYTGRYWYGQQENQGPQFLNFTSDKDEYQVGEDIKLNIPSNADSKIYVSIENGSEVLQSFWVDAEEESTEINVPTTAEMNPNIYIHAMLVQKHKMKENDLPLRMYGVLDLTVIDPATTLRPQLNAPDKAQPNTDFEIEVRETHGQAMSYTLAVVDEGLLGLTRFETPDAWAHFYAKQAIGVKTWDIYDKVLSGVSADMDKYISVGGDAVNRNAVKEAKANRFKAVVKHLGPFRLEAGQTATHQIRIEDYVGAVRAMVVCRDKQKYGHADQSILIKKPLMVQATFPRVLGLGEELDAPANVFAMEDNIKSVDVSIKANELVTLSAQTNETLTFQKAGDQLSTFRFKVGDQVGVADFQVVAKSGNESGSESVEIEIRNPNPVITKVQQSAIQPGESWSTTYETFGTQGTNAGVVEVSNMMPINLEQRLNYLIRYPYGCIEQTVSSVFPQLYLNQLVELTPDQIHKTEKSVKRAIERLSLFQLPSGAMSYWPGNHDISPWGSIYALHFLVEAQSQGHFVPNALYDNLIKYLDNSASSYRDGTESQYYYYPGISQAYRLYVLALSDNPNISAMNRMRNSDELIAPNSHLLAGAYALINQNAVAKEILRGKQVVIEPYRETGYSYGSDMRDQAIVLDALMTIGDLNEAANKAEYLATALNSDRWYSTHSTAFALSSIGRYVGNYTSESLDAVLTSGNADPITLATDKVMVQQSIEVDTDNKSIKITNEGEGVIYARLYISGREAPVPESQATSKHLAMEVVYQDLNGKKIDPSKLQLGTDFLATVSIKNLGSKSKKIEEIALSQIFPSGWEIQNLRLSGMQNVKNDSPYDYKDIRDDRVNVFFDMGDETKTFTTLLTAAYAGKFFQPPIYAEAMYDQSIQAKSTSQWVEVYQ